MSVLVRFAPPSMTAEQYDAIVNRLYDEGIHPADGLELEVCFGSGDQMKVNTLAILAILFQLRLLATSTNWSEDYETREQNKPTT